MTTGILYCKNHPERETGLRCKNCNEPICASCAKRTPTGYICPECQRDQGRKFDTATMLDYFVGFTIAAVMSLIGSFIATFIGWFIFFIAPAVGIAIAEVVRAAVGRRRSKLLFQVVTAGVAVGGLASSLGALMAVFFGSFGALLGLLWPAIYIVLAASSTYVRLSGIQLNR
jgi:hypothetical protein